MEAKDHYTYDRQNWFNIVGEEVKATREKAVLIDQTSFAKFKITGSQALDALEYICSNKINREIGSTVYTQMLNSHENSTFEYIQWIQSLCLFYWNKYTLMHLKPANL